MQFKPTSLRGALARRGNPFSCKCARSIIASTLCTSLLLQSLFIVPAQTFASVEPTDIIGGVALSNFVDIEPGRPSQADSVDISARSFALTDKAGQILYAREADQPVQMASIAKIMNAIVALESTHLDTEMLVTRGASTVEGSSAELPEGARLTLHELLYCMLVPSGNDAAVAIAENISGRQSDYTELMNNKAQELGLTNTHYSDSTGLNEENQYSTALDTLKLARYAMQNSVFAEIVGQSKHKLWIDGDEVELISSNDLYFSHSATLDVTGIKTGTNDNAGFCLVASARRANNVVGEPLELTAALFNANTKPEVIDDADTLLSWGFEHYVQTELISANETVGALSLTAWLDRTVEVKVNNLVKADIFIFNGPISAMYATEGHAGAVSEGQRVGQLIYKQGDLVLVTCDLIAIQSVPEPNWFEGLGLFWQKLFVGLFGGQTSAASQLYITDYFYI